jgi:hypothetical protein
MTQHPVWAAAAAEVDDVIRQVAADRPGWLEARLQPPHIAVDGSGCWVWQHPTCPRGYARLSMGQPYDRKLRVHRVAYILNRGPIPYGMTLDHLCRNTSCVNPDHLEPCSVGENRARAPQPGSQHNKAKTTCPRGHAYEGENLREAALRTGRRECRACHTARFVRDRELQRRAAQRLDMSLKGYLKRHGASGRRAAEVLGIPWEAARHIAA